ncbi:hypothetical protein N7452_008121 [Penicillium brevicompactum]|uniref:Uncharacterized protein n=1 Tax=Penicillium brevicompactum TaxID=5074 RepID=A0A9W9Q5X3_PENBR|nr:hypothetical protein N7452_008121 [Penicillium brevicompactum]
MYGFNIITTVALFGLAHAGDKIGFGPNFAVSSTGSTWIKEGNTTFILPETPSPQVERLAIWPGMETSNGNLVQALAVSFEDPAANCGAQKGQWCVWASTLKETQISGKMVPASPGDKITMHYVYNDSTGEYDQSSAINGEIVSTLSTSSGQAQRWDVAVECQVDACTRRSPPHRYVDTTIILNEANPYWSRGLYTKWSENSGLETIDGGRTWTVSTIELNSHLYDESDIQYD